MPRRHASRVVEPTTPPGGWRTVSSDDPEAWPQAVVLDLDHTLWDLSVDTHVTPPLTRKGDAVNLLHDRRNHPLFLFREVPAILAELKRRKIHIAAASRTCAPEIAREALGLLLVPDEEGRIVKAISYFKTMEIYPGSKLRHFKAINKRTSIPCEQMLFFDDEYRNFEVESLGVTMCLVGRELDWKTFREGLATWRRRRGLKVVDGDGEGH